MEIIKGEATVEAVVPAQTVDIKQSPPSAKPTTTEESDRGSASQRYINLLWERTQQLIALSVVGMSLFVSGWLAISSSPDARGATVFLFGVANLVIGFYFGRTNHTRTGGVGHPGIDTR